MGLYARVGEQERISTQATFRQAGKSASENVPETIYIKMFLGSQGKGKYKVGTLGAMILNIGSLLCQNFFQRI